MWLQYFTSMICLLNLARTVLSLPVGPDVYILATKGHNDNARLSLKSSANIPQATSASTKSSIAQGFRDTVNVFGDTLHRYSQQLSNEATNPVLDTVDAALNGLSKEFAVVALNVRNSMEPKDWNAFHLIANFLMPLVRNVTLDASQVAETHDRPTHPPSTTESRIDRFNRFETYIESLKDLSIVAKAFELNTGDLDLIISRLQDLLGKI